MNVKMSVHNFHGYELMYLREAIIYIQNMTFQHQNCCLVVDCTIYIYIYTRISGRYVPLILGWGLPPHRGPSASKDGLCPSWDLITTFGPPLNKLAVRPPLHTQVVCPPPWYTYAVRPPQPVCGVCPQGQTSCVWGGTNTYICCSSPSTCVLCLSPGTNRYLVTHWRSALYIYRFYCIVLYCMSPGTNKLFVPGDKQNVTHWRTDPLTKRFIYIDNNCSQNNSGRQNNDCKQNNNSWQK